MYYALTIHMYCMWIYFHTAYKCQSLDCSANNFKCKYVVDIHYVIYINVYRETNK